MMNRRCLMIDSASLCELKMDGPALRIRAENKSRQWFPLRRISMVICLNIPIIGMKALATIAHEGIPVNFFNRKGTLMAQLIHPGRIPNPLSHWLEAIDNDTSLSAAYDIWLENQLRHTYGLIGCITCNSRYSAIAAETQLKKLAKVANCLGIIKQAREWFEGLLTAQIQMHGSRLGISASSTQLVRIIRDLQEAGVMFCLTYMAATLANKHAAMSHGIARFYESELSENVDQWARRALYSLSGQLERTAMSHDAPLKRT